MTKLARNALRFALAAAVGTVCLLINDNTSTAQRSSLISQADARVGEPVTPMSVAGVGRRHARRAVRRSYAARYGTGAYGRYPSGYYGAYTLYPGGFYGVYPAYPGRSYGAYGSYPRGYSGGYPSYYERY